MTDDRGAALAEFANASGQKNQPQPAGHALSRTIPNAMPMLDETETSIVGARNVQVHRDEGLILKKITALAAAAGPDWFYRYPVKSADGRQDWIEGPSIKLANAVASLYMNNDIDLREVDMGDSWTFYARFTDWENGTRMTRAYRQRKGQRTMKTKDADRSLDIAFQVGQSKAIRNIVVNALGVYCDFAFDEARNSLVDKIGKDIAGWRTRTIERLKQLPVDLARVERVIGRSANDWLAPDIARIVAMGKAIADGMATVDETFPPIETTTASPTEPSPPDDAQSAKSGGSSPIEEAHQRGQEAKAAGHSRRAVPGEYREDQRLTEAWVDGFDAVPMATGGQNEKQ